MKLDPSTQRFIILANIMVLLAFATISNAGEIPKHITQGITHVGLHIPTPKADGPRTRSVSLKREDTGEQVLCIEVIDETEVESDTDLITRTGEGILLRGYAYSKPDCTGLVSEASADVFRLTFGNPERPVLVRVE